MVVLGLRARTGLAEVIAIERETRSGAVERGPRFVARAHLVLADPADRFCYHAAAEMPLGRAELHVRAALVTATARATAGLRVLIEEGAAAGAARAGLVLGKSRPLPPLEQIMKVHALWHAAEGEHYRRALDDACAELGLAVVGVAAAELAARAAAALGVSDAVLRERLGEMGRAAGSPWTIEQKECVMAAVVAQARRGR
jgi:hypothetical protein